MVLLQNHQMVGQLIAFVSGRDVLFQVSTAGLDTIEETLAGIALADLTGEVIHDAFPDLVIHPGGNAPVDQYLHIPLRL